MEKELTTQDWNMVSEVELVYRSKIKASHRPLLQRPKEVHEFLLCHWDKNKIELLEESKVIFLNRSNRVMGLMNLSTGGVSGTVMDPKLIFTTALKINASALILTHNHPSGNLKPGEADKLVTNKILEGGKLLDIRLVDHIIVTIEGFFSFADEGLL